jgi:hypothetical protein
MSRSGSIGTTVGKFPTYLDDFIAATHPSRESFDKCILLFEDYCGANIPDFHGKVKSEGT